MDAWKPFHDRIIPTPVGPDPSVESIISKTPGNGSGTTVFNIFTHDGVRNSVAQGSDRMAPVLNCAIQGTDQAAAGLSFQAQEGPRVTIQCRRESYCRHLAASR